MLSISFFVILPRSFEFSFVIKIGSPNSIVVSALLNFLRLGRAFSVPPIRARVANLRSGWTILESDTKFIGYNGLPKKCGHQLAHRNILGFTEGVFPTDEIDGDRFPQPQFPGDNFHGDRIFDLIFYQAF